MFERTLDCVIGYFEVELHGFIVLVPKSMTQTDKGRGSVRHCKCMCSGILKNEEVRKTGGEVTVRSGEDTNDREIFGKSFLVDIRVAFHFFLI